jgi:hypothetical protein
VKISIDYLEEEGLIVPLLTQLQRRRLSASIEERLEQAKTMGYVPGEPLDPEVPGLYDSVQAIAYMSTQLASEEVLRETRADEIKTVYFVMEDPRMEHQDEVHRRIGWSAEDESEIEEGTHKPVVRWSDAPAICYELLDPQVSEGWDGPLRIEFEIVLREICQDLIFPILSRRARFFTTGSSSDLPVTKPSPSPTSAKTKLSGSGGTSDSRTSRTVTPSRTSPPV